MSNQRPAAPGTASQAIARNALICIAWFLGRSIFRAAPIASAITAAVKRS